MQKLATAIKDYSYRREETKTAIAIDKVPLSAPEADAVIKSCVDLIDDKRYEPFFYKKLYKLGKSRFLEMAERARKYGNSNGKFFVHLLK